MQLDIRLPIGLLFSFLGLLLIGYGVLGDGTVYHRSLGININAWWGLGMFVFGAVMLILGRRGSSVVRSTEESHEGRLIEEREHREGLEKPSSSNH